MQCTTLYLLILVQIFHELKHTTPFINPANPKVAAFHFIHTHSISMHPSRRYDEGFENLSVSNTNLKRENGSAPVYAVTVEGMESGAVDAFLLKRGGGRASLRPPHSHGHGRQADPVSAGGGIQRGGHRRRQTGELHL